MKNKIVYPIYEKLIDLTKDMEENEREFKISKLREIISGIVKEYEHGTADVHDVEGVNLKQYSAVCHDILLCIEHHYEIGDKE